MSYSYNKKTNEEKYQDNPINLEYKGYYLHLDDEKIMNKMDLILEEISNKFVKDNASSISSSQLRNIFHRIQNVKTPTELKLLRPNLAYIAARQQDQVKSKNSIKFIDELIKEVNDEESLRGFKKFMEIVVAYHKYHSKEK